METYNKITYKNIMSSLKPKQKIEYQKLELSRFKLVLQYIGKIGHHNLDVIELDGITNAVNIFEMYKKFGHNMKLRSLVVYDMSTKSKIKKINFKYSSQLEKF